MGETSDGSNLLKASEKYAYKIGDPDYLQAVKLFIKEEQKHGNNLGRYLDAIGVPRIQEDWGDSLFRKVRYFNSNMHLWTLTVVIVESFAQLYYKAIADCSYCPLLKQICHDILVDEAHHIKFQTERLFVLTKLSDKHTLHFTLVFYRTLFFAIMIAVWIGHRKAFMAGGLSFPAYVTKAKRKFKSITNKIIQFHQQTSAEKFGYHIN